MSDDNNNICVKRSSQQYKHNICQSASDNSDIDEIRDIAYFENLTKKKIAISWDIDQENILKIWAEKASGWAWMHDRASRYYNNLTNNFTYPAIFLSTLSGGIGFSIAGNANCSSFFTRNMTIVIGGLNVLSAFLSSMHKFVRTTEKSEIHSHLNKQFSSFSRKIVLELSLKPEDRRDCLEFCKFCRDEYDRLITETPIIPSSIVDNFKKEFATCSNKPEIANGLVQFDTTRASMNNEKTRKRIKKFMKSENSNNSDSLIRRINDTFIDKNINHNKNHHSNEIRVDVNNL